MKRICFSLSGILLLLAFSSCVRVNSDLNDGIKFHNDVNKNVVLVAMDEELAHTIDLLEYMQLAEDDDRIIRPGETKKIALNDIDGDYTSDKNLYIFTYSDKPDYLRDPQSENDLIFYNDHFRIFSYNELYQNNFQLLISEIKTTY